MRFLLAFSCFFRLLFTGRLPAKAADFLPANALPALPAAREPAPPEPAPAKPAPAPAPAAATPRGVTASQQQRDGALALLGLLQREGRLVDFLQEPLDGFEDADIGAAVRDIHRGCAKVVADHFTLEPVMPGDEEAAVTVPVGFDPGEIRLTGSVNGDPPFKGVLRHHGWRATKAVLPALSDDIDRRVVSPAEVEVS